MQATVNYDLEGNISKKTTWVPSIYGLSETYSQQEISKHSDTIKHFTSKQAFVWSSIKLTNCYDCKRNKIKKNEIKPIESVMLCHS